LAVILENEIEQQLWVDVFKEFYFTKEPEGIQSERNKLCGQYADEAILVFRARRGKFKSVSVAPVCNLTNDIKFQQTHCKDYDN
jgi:hypothetical protein